VFISVTVRQLSILAQVHLFFLLPEKSNPVLSEGIPRFGRFYGPIVLIDLLKVGD